MVVAERCRLGQKAWCPSIQGEFRRKEASIGGGVLPTLIGGIAEILPLEGESAEHRLGALGIVGGLFFQGLQFLKCFGDCRRIAFQRRKLRLSHSQAHGGFIGMRILGRFLQRFFEEGLVGSDLCLEMSLHRELGLPGIGRESCNGLVQIGYLRPVCVQDTKRQKREHDER